MICTSINKSVLCEGLKTAGYILMLILAFLTVQPVMSSAINLDAKTECCSKEGDCSGKEKNPCRQNACNPLRACVYGNFFVVDSSDVHIINILLKESKIPTTNDKRRFTALSDCWHPPRVFPA